MSRESSSQGVHGYAQASSHEPNNEDAENSDTIQEPSEPDSSAPSNDHQPTPPSDNGDPDDSSSEHDDNASLSDDSHDSQELLQRDCLEEFLRPAKKYLFQRLMVYIANDRSLGLPPPMASLFGCAGTVNTGSPDPLTSLPSIQKWMPKQEALQDYDGCCFLAAGLEESPTSADQGSSDNRAHGKRSRAPASHDEGRTGAYFTRKRKTRGAGSPNNDGNESDDEGEQRGGPKQCRSPSPHPGYRGLRIACPYFKRNPRSPPKNPSCFQNGFKDVTKMKEHLDRVHNCSIRCPRCYLVFKKQKEVDDHLRVDQICVQIQEPPLVDGYNAAQAEELKGRRRSQPLEDKWRAIWGILFPSDPEHEIPPPCKLSLSLLTHPDPHLSISDQYFQGG
ncbi:hypothetical protein BK809_0007822 [Diplodia seriata]|uniref:C2H2-type domain-containing protein n=1 Tax=Diplodia seriata TaxID=420778 RepID=A0A1S8BJS3_9PEZI|nr:hypothetical protein BK809_0007822 [Diplodia seriata]